MPKIADYITAGGDFDHLGWMRHLGKTMPEYLDEIEAALIRRALAETEGLPTRAAEELGVKHQTLIHALKHRHKELLALRSFAYPRRRSIIRKGRPKLSEAEKLRRRLKRLEEREAEAKPTSG